MKFVFENLEIWQESIQLNKLIYKVSSKFPKEEIYSLVSQMRLAKGSLFELITATEISHNLEYIDKDSYSEIRKQSYKLLRRIVALTKYIEKDAAKRLQGT